MLCRCSASGDIPRAFQQPNMIPIMWVLSLSAVLCWLTTESCTSGFKAFDDDISDCYCDARSDGPWVSNVVILRQNSQVVSQSNLAISCVCPWLLPC